MTDSRAPQAAAMQHTPLATSSPRASTRNSQHSLHETLGDGRKAHDSANRSIATTVGTDNDQPRQESTVKDELTTQALTSEAYEVEKTLSHERRIDDSRWLKAWKVFIAILKDQWFLVGIAVIVAIASQVQVPAAQQAQKQVIATYVAVSNVFFFTGLMLDTRALIDNYAKWKHHLFVQAECFLVVSALGFAVVSLAALNRNFLDPWILIGLIFNACQPTTIASNVMLTRHAHGNATLTVVETTLGNFLGPFLSPVLIKMYLLSGAWYTGVVPPQSGGYGALYRRVFMQLGLSIYLPMVVGQVIRYFFPKTVKKVCVDWKVGKLSSLSLLLLLWQTFDHAFETGAFRAVPPSNLIFCTFVGIINYSIWFGVAFGTSVVWMGRKDVVSTIMCVPAKTLALAVPLSFLLFTDISALDEAKIQIPLVLFQVMQIGCASLSTGILRKWVDRDEARKLATAETATSHGNV